MACVTAPKKDEAKPSTSKLVKSSGGVQKKQDPKNDQPSSSRPAKSVAGNQKIKDSSHEAISYRHMTTRSRIRQYWSSKEYAIGVSNQKRRGPTGRGDGGGQCGFFVFADLVTIVHRMNKRIGKDVFMSAQCGLDWGRNLKRTPRTFQRFCTNPRLGFETTNDYPYEGVPRVLSTDWSHCHRDGVMRYLVDRFSNFQDKKDFRPAIANNFNGPAYPCMATIASHLLRNQDKPDGEDDKYHAVLIVGADFRSIKPEDHTVHIKNSWGKDWGEGGFGDVRIDLLSYICVPHYSPV